MCNFKSTIILIRKKIIALNTLVNDPELYQLLYSNQFVFLYVLVKKKRWMNLLVDQSGLCLTRVGVRALLSERIVGN